ncbi:MAG: patatin family protein [Lachnospira sp.]
MKKGLILEGGAMRGMFTCGVIDVLMENGIEFDGTVGVSAGAAFGANYKSRQIGRGVRYNKKYCKDKRYCSWKSLITTGDIYNVDFCYNKLPYELDVMDSKAFRENPMEFYAVCTDVTTGKPAYHKCETPDGDDLNWIRASASMPLVSRVVEVDGRKLLDGGIGDSIPIKFFEDLGYDRNVVVLTRPAGYVKKKPSIMPLIRLGLLKYPEMAHAMAVRHIMYNDTTEYIRKQEEDRKVFVIRPPKALEVGKMEKNPDRLEEVYQLGRETALKELPGMIKYLEG